MKALTLLGVLALAWSVALAAERPPIRMVPMPRATQAPGGGAFQVECIDVQQLSGSGSFEFKCRKADATTVLIRVAREYDNSGNYYVGHDQATGASLGDLYAAGAISQVVGTFALLKALNPASPAVLHVSGIHSKLAAANGAPVATAVYLLITK